MEPVTVTVAGAKKALGIGTTKIYELIGQGQLHTVKLGRTNADPHGEHPRTGR